jgi:glycosyltransferase involved in cell wall biosynthesis
MRIAMISTPFIAVPPHGYGGTELVVYELVEGLVARGHHVTLFATGDSKTTGELRFVYDKAQWPPSSMKEISHVSAAMDHIARGGYDIIHAHSAVALGYSRLLPHIPMVYTLHHHREEDMSELYMSFPNVHYVAISHRQKNLEAPLPRCSVIYHGLDPGRFEFSPVADNYVCFIGRLSAEKGPHDAIDAARIAGLPIQVGGEPHWPDRWYFEHEVQERLKEPHVTYLHGVDDSKKIPLLKKARALLTPVNWEEPFGLILIEAMLSGCPVISFPRGSTPELIEPNITGYLVESAAEMAELIRPGGIVESFDRHRCRDRAIVRFSRDRLVTDHLRLYSQILEENASADALVA